MNDSNTPFGRGVIDAILAVGESNLGRGFDVRDDGVWVRRLTADELDDLTTEEREALESHPEFDLSRPALPFPFSQDDFTAFCIARPLFSWYSVVEPFTSLGVNDPEDQEQDPRILDDEPLHKLGRRGLPGAQAEALVRGCLAQMAPWLFVRKADRKPDEWEAWKAGWLKTWWL